jgi:hypothetical protein
MVELDLAALKSTARRTAEEVILKQGILDGLKTSLSNVIINANDTGVQQALKRQILKDIQEKIATASTDLSTALTKNTEAQSALQSAQKAALTDAKPIIAPSIPPNDAATTALRDSIGKDKIYTDISPNFNDAITKAQTGNTAELTAIKDTANNRLVTEVSDPTKSTLFRNKYTKYMTDNPGTTFAILIGTGIGIYEFVSIMNSYIKDNGAQLNITCSYSADQNTNFTCPGNNANIFLPNVSNNVVINFNPSTKVVAGDSVTISNANFVPSLNDQTFAVVAINSGTSITINVPGGLTTYATAGTLTLITGIGNRMLDKVTSTITNTGSAVAGVTSATGTGIGEIFGGLFKGIFNIFSGVSSSNGIIGLISCFFCLFMMFTLLKG